MKVEFEVIKGKYIEFIHSIALHILDVDSGAIYPWVIAVVSTSLINRQPDVSEVLKAKLRYLL